MARKARKEKKNTGYSAIKTTLACLTFGAVMMFWTIYNAYVPLILDYQLNNLGSVVLSTTVVSTLTGFIMTIDNFFGLIFQPIFGHKSDYMHSRYGKRMPYVIVGIPICAVLFVMIPVVVKIGGMAGLVAMMAVIICFNLMMSVWRAPCVAIMADVVPVEYQPDGSAIQDLLGAAASILASMAATILSAMGFADAINNGDYTSIFMYGSLICVLLLVMSLVFVRWKDNRAEKIEVKEEEKKESFFTLNISPEAKKSLIFAMLACFLFSGASDGYGTFSTLFATKFLGITATTATLVGSLSAMGALLFAIPAGVLGRKAGLKRAMYIGTIFVIASHIALLVLPYVFEPETIFMPLLVVYFVYSIAYVVVNINALPILLAIGGPDRFGTFTGYYYFATFGAAVVCPTVIGFLIGITGTYATLQLFCLAAMVVSIWCIKSIKHGTEVVTSEDTGSEE